MKELDKEIPLNTVDEIFSSSREEFTTLMFRTDSQRCKDRRQERGGDGRKGWSEKSWGWEVEMEGGRRKWKSVKDQKWACPRKWDFSNLLFLCSFQERPLGQDEIDGNYLLKCPSMLATHISSAFLCKFFHVNIPFLPLPVKCNLHSSFCVSLGSVSRVSMGCVCLICTGLRNSEIVSFRAI